jgi:cytochrome bd-type quinol oxidase subunit 1
MTMRMEMTDFYEVLFNEVAQAKFVHTVSAGYVTASVFVLGVSAWYLLADAISNWPGARSRLRQPSASHRRSPWCCWAMSRATRHATPRK